jgi:putative ABC transport system substrate-binding protein
MWRSVIRCLVTLILSLFAAPLAAEAQQAPQIAKIGWIIPSTPAATAHFVEAFRQGLRELGHVEGKTFVLELRYGESRAERFPDLARELVSLKVDVILAGTDLAISAAKQQTQTIPIVMTAATDAVGTKFVASLARPGGNVTGFSTISPDLSGKRLELLREAVPGLSRVAFLWNPEARGHLIDYQETEGAARSLHLELQSVEVSRGEDLDRALSALTKGRTQALIVPAGNPIAVAKRAQVASFVRQNRLPSLYGGQEFMEGDGLMSFGPNTRDMFRRAATYVDKILKGAKPADLPVEQPTKFELVINLKIAKALGLTIPPSLLQRADQVIE